MRQHLLACIAIQQPIISIILREIIAYNLEAEADRFLLVRLKLMKVILAALPSRSFEEKKARSTPDSPFVSVVYSDCCGRRIGHYRINHSKLFADGKIYQRH